MAQNADGSQRIRRPRRGSTPDLPRRRSTRGRKSSLVPQSTRYDRLDHMPSPLCGKKNRQRCWKCGSFTNMTCEKCKVHLCCFYGRNCFKPWHYERFEVGGSAQNDVSVEADPDSPQPSNANVSQGDESNEDLQSVESDE